MASDMNTSPSNPPTRPHFSSPFSSYVASSIRMQGPRFNYYTPSPYPRPRSSASKPNPSFHGENMNDFPNVNDCSSPSHSPMFRNEQSFSMHHNESKDMNFRFKDNGYESPNSEYYSCSEGSFMSPVTPDSVRGSFQGSGFPSRSGQQHSNSRRLFPSNYGPERNGVSPAGIKRSVPEDVIHAANFPHNKSFDERQQVHYGFPIPPLKKPKLIYRCELCSLDFTSEIPYNMHVVGAKHSKKLKAEEHLKALQSQGQVTQIDKRNALRCDTCEIVVNSYQQMQMHLDGMKHRNKCKKLSMLVEESANSPQDETQKADEPAENITPQTETLAENVIQRKLGNFACEICSLSLNSETQLQQHKGSKRHQAKVEGKPVPRKKKNKKAANILEKPANEEASTDLEAEAVTEESNTLAQTITGEIEPMVAVKAELAVAVEVEPMAATKMEPMAEVKMELAATVDMESTVSVKVEADSAEAEVPVFIEVEEDDIKSDADAENQVIGSDSAQQECFQDLEDSSALDSVLK